MGKPLFIIAYAAVGLAGFVVWWLVVKPSLIRNSSSIAIAVVAAILWPLSLLALGGLLIDFMKGKRR